MSKLQTVSLPKEEASGYGVRVVDMLVQAKLATSISDARRSIEGKAVRLADHLVTNVNSRLMFEKDTNIFYLIEPV